ncbi:hypothetical protein [Microcoleus sp.]|uniref:hypothetical protein n=1 Tax=Microcoleus sp. TaxID=44472 RepID=UPI00359302B5
MHIAILSIAIDRQLSEIGRGSSRIPGIPKPRYLSSGTDTSLVSRVKPDWVPIDRNRKLEA